MRNIEGLLGFHYIKYDKLETIDNKKLEEAVLDMLVNFKYTPLELETMILDELYSKVDAKWECTLMTKCQIIEATIAQVIPNLEKLHMSIALRDHTKRFVPKLRAYLILKNKIEEVIGNIREVIERGGVNPLPQK